MVENDVAYLSVYQLSIYNRTSSRLIAINKLQRFICDKKQNSGIGISYNDKRFIHELQRKWYVSVCRMLT